ncbi:MAG TPA: hypothetical protein GX006_02445 [Clostridiales bacterium]|nr:hypothetical protein [Clostridiales bacterium]
MVRISKEQARDYFVQYHFLDKRLPKTQIDRVFARLQTIQFDPLNIISRNADLVLKARVRNYRPSDLEKWLYQDRYLVDGWDKMLNIYRASDRPRMAPVSHRCARGLEARGRELLEEEFEPRVDMVRQRLLAGEKLKNSSLTKEFGVLHPGQYSSYQILDYLFHLGEAEIAKKEKGQKVYQLSTSPERLTADEAFFDWYTLRRVKATGLIRAGSSEAWLGYWIYYTDWRNPAIKRLLDQGLITQVAIDGIKGHFVVPTEALPQLEQVKPTRDMVRFLAPLDNFMWDRKLIEQLFDFYYRWEVYVPKAKRRWGYYVLPILHKSRLIGRIEPVRRADNKLEVLNIWWEEGVGHPGATFEEELESFRTFLSI